MFDASAPYLPDTCDPTVVLGFDFENSKVLLLIYDPGYDEAYVTYGGATGSAVNEFLMYLCGQGWIDEYGGDDEGEGAASVIRRHTTAASAPIFRQGS
jgi:hypothetical protein